METRYILRQKRKARVRAKVTGNAQRPRLSVFRSNRALYAQLIDDTKGITLVSAKKIGIGRTVGKELGHEIAKLALSKKINAVVFDRDGYRFHGTVKEIADGAREGGLTL